MSESNGYRFLVRRPESTYKQLFVRGTKKRALFLYMATVPHPDDPTHVRTPEEVAEDFGVPVEAVYEAIHYCESKPVEIEFDKKAEDLLIEAHGMNHPDYPKRPQELFRVLTADDRARIASQLMNEFGPL